MQAEAEEHRIYVGNLSNDIKEWDLDAAFVLYGPTFNVTMPHCRRFGFVSYYSKEDAELAIEGMNGTYLGDQALRDNRAIRVDWADGWPKTSESEDEEDESEDNNYDTVLNQTSPNNRTVYIAGFPQHFNKEKFEEYFSCCGAIEEITVFDDRRNYAFIRFAHKDSAVMAIRAGNGHEIDGEPIRCSWSRRPNYPDSDFSATSSESSPESSRSSSPALDDFDTIFNQTTENNCTVFCGGLSGLITQSLLESVFSPYGDIDQISLYTERSDFAFIRFVTKISAALAICAVNGTEINGETVTCSWSRRPDYRPPVVEAQVPSISAVSNSLPSQPEAVANSLSSQPEAVATSLPNQPEAVANSLPSQSVSQVLEALDDFGNILSQTTENNCTVYCGGLSGQFNECSLETVFSPYGEIDQINFSTGRSNYAFIRFRTKISAALAICAINGTTIDGNTLTCSWARRPDFHPGVVQGPVPSTSAVSNSLPSQPETVANSLPSQPETVANSLPIQPEAVTSMPEAAASSASLPVDEPRDLENVLSQTTENNCTVYCGGLSGHFNESLLETVFRSYGDIDQIFLYSERLDYAFIRFHTKISAALAICAVNGRTINGNTLTCSWPRRPDFCPGVVQDPVPTTSAASNSLPSQPKAVANSLPCQPEAVTSLCEAASSASLPVDEPQEESKAKAKIPDLKCKICMDEELGIVFLPCGHLASCTKCAKKIYHCPICRKRITGKIRTFLS